MASLQLPNCKKKSAAHKNGFEVLVQVLRASAVANAWCMHKSTLCMIGTIILKIDLANPNWGQSWHPSFRNLHFAITESKKTFWCYRCQLNFDLNYISYFWIKFKNSCGYHVANFQGCSTKVGSSSVCAQGPKKILLYVLQDQRKWQKQSGPNVLGHPVIVSYLWKH